MIYFLNRKKKQCRDININTTQIIRFYEIIDSLRVHVITKQRMIVERLGKSTILVTCIRCDSRLNLGCFKLQWFRTKCNIQAIGKNGHILVIYDFYVDCLNHTSDQ